MIAAVSGALIGCTLAAVALVVLAVTAVASWLGGYR